MSNDTPDALPNRSVTEAAALLAEDYRAAAEPSVHNLVEVVTGALQLGWHAYERGWVTPER